MHRRVHRGIGKGVAKIRVLAVSGAGSDHTSRVKILDGQLSLVLRLRVLAQITLHEECKVDTLRVLWVIKRCLRVSLLHHGLVIVDKASIGALANHDDAVALKLGALNERLVDTVRSIQLEADIRH